MGAKKKYDINDFKMSNYLINGKYRASLTQVRILALALSQLSSSMKKDKIGRIVSEFRLKKYEDTYHTECSYKQLKKAAPGLAGMVVGTEDPIKHSFHYHPIINDCIYDDGILTIVWHENAEPYLIDYENKYTLLNLSILAEFQSVNSFKIYELLKMHLYQTKQIEYSLAELFLILGTVNTQLDAVKNILNDSTPDYEKAVAKAPERTYKNWGNFRKKVLIPSIAEINEKTDIIVDFQPLTKGRGGKIVGVKFLVQYKQDVIVEENIPQKEEISTQSPTVDDIDDFCDQIRKLFPNLSTKELKTIAKDANYNYQLIKEKHGIMLRNSSPIKNVVGWMKQAIKEDYQQSPSQINGAYTLTHCEQMNLDDLEPLLLDN